MPHQVHLCLRIGALVSSLLLLTGFIAYRTGLLFPQSVITQNQPNESFNLNLIGTGFSQPNTYFGQAELAVVDQPKLSGVNRYGVPKIAGVMEYDVLSANGAAL